MRDGAFWRETFETTEAKQMRESGESKEVAEWQERFVWFEPSKVNLENEELHWQKITPEIAQESFDALKRMRPFIEERNLENHAEVLRCRDYLAEITKTDNTKIFSEKDLRFLIYILATLE